MAPADKSQNSISWTKYFALMPLNTIATVLTIHPCMVLQTRVYSWNRPLGSVFRGTWRGINDPSKLATMSASSSNGSIRNLYRGSSAHIWSFAISPLYMGTYEYTRHQFGSEALAGATGTAASLLASVPRDNITQRMIAHRGSEKITLTNVSRNMWSGYGLRGFYRGALLSFAMQAPGSALFWTCYTRSRELTRYSPSLVPACAAVSGAVSQVAFAPLDKLRMYRQLNMPVTRLHLRELIGRAAWQGSRALAIRGALQWSVALSFYECLKYFAAK